jgi:ribonuclease Z
MFSKFEVLLLGTNSALPMHGRNPTSQYLQFHKNHFLIDCGEGTQHQMNTFRVKRNKISHIFISHLHGDHVYGLPGLLGSYAHFGRKQELTVFGPHPIKNMLQTIFDASEARFGFDLKIIEINPSIPATIVINEEVSVQTFPLKHRIPTMGYRFDFVPTIRNLIKAQIEKHQLSVAQIKNLIAGDDLVLENGSKLKNEEFTFKKWHPKHYAYCSDTIYDKEIIAYLDKVDLLYHETTYLDGLEKEAKERMHSTIGQAIKISQMADVKKLLTGHYSSRYNNLTEFRKVAENSSVEVMIGSEGNKYIF